MVISADLGGASRGGGGIDINRRVIVSFCCPSGRHKCERPARCTGCGSRTVLYTDGRQSSWRICMLKFGRYFALVAVLAVAVAGCGKSDAEKEAESGKSG